MNATVGDVMTTRVIAVKRSTDYKQICCVLRLYRVSACPVINDAGKVVGVVSEADLLYKIADPHPPSGLIRLQWKLGEESKVNAVTAGQLMTSPAISIQPGRPGECGSSRDAGPSRAASSRWRARWRDWTPPWRCWCAPGMSKAWLRSATGSLWPKLADTYRARSRTWPGCRPAR